MNLPSSLSGAMVFLLSSCGSSGIQYSGVYADPVVRASEVEQWERPIDATLLGEVRASCEVPSGGLEDGIAYGDLLCSEQLLRSALIETAAYVGGTHLAEVRCVRDDAEHECSASVLRLAQGDRALPRRPFADPFAVEVRLRDAQKLVAARRGVPGDARVVPRLPVSDRVMGEVTATCDGECDEAMLRDAIAVGGRYAGAEHIGYADCRAPRDATLPGTARRCRAWASAYDIDVASGD